MKFVHKPLVVDAKQWDGDIAAMQAWLVSSYGVSELHWHWILSSRGELTFMSGSEHSDCEIGDWVVHGVLDSLQVVSDDVFKASYVLVVING